jgi:hypothetical protein
MEREARARGLLEGGAEGLEEPEVGGARRVEERAQLLARLVLQRGGTRSASASQSVSQSVSQPASKPVRKICRSIETRLHCSFCAKFLQTAKDLPQPHVHCAARLIAPPSPVPANPSSLCLSEAASVLMSGRPPARWGPSGSSVRESSSQPASHPLSVTHGTHAHAQEAKRQALATHRLQRLHRVLLQSLLDRIFCRHNILGILLDLRAPPGRPLTRCATTRHAAGTIARGRSDSFRMELLCTRGATRRGLCAQRCGDSLGRRMSAEASERRRLVGAIFWPPPPRPVRAGAAAGAAAGRGVRGAGRGGAGRGIEPPARPSKRSSPECPARPSRPAPDPPVLARAPPDERTAQRPGARWPGRGRTPGWSTAMRGPAAAAAPRQGAGARRRRRRRQGRGRVGAG